MLKRVNFLFVCLFLPISCNILSTIYNNFWKVVSWPILCRCQRLATPQLYNSWIYYYYMLVRQHSLCTETHEFIDRKPTSFLKTALNCRNITARNNRFHTNTFLDNQIERNPCLTPKNIMCHTVTYVRHVYHLNT